jgi:hypothetical protein
MIDVGTSERDLKILRDPKLFDKITYDEFDKTIVDEKQARRAIFLGLCSLWVKKHQGLPNILVNSESSAGKSYIVKQIVKIFPNEMTEYRTKISAEAFTYWHNPKDEPDWTWDGKILYLEDTSQKILDSDTFKVMCSEGSKATVVIKQKAYDINIVGKPILILTTANTNPNNEVLNRFTIITLTETPEQTRKIIEGQAKKAAMEYEEKYDLTIIQALRSLRRVDVIIPFAEEISKLFPNDQIRVRRDFPRFLDLIRASAAFHQYQRPLNGGMVIAQKEDYDIAYEVFQSINTSAVFGMTKKLKNAYDACLKIVEENKCELGDRFTAKEIFCFRPFVNERSWYTLLDDLAKVGLLEISLERRGESDKRVMHFSPITLNKKQSINVKGIVGIVGLDSFSSAKSPDNTSSVTSELSNATNATNGNRGVKSSIDEAFEKNNNMILAEVVEELKRCGYLIPDGSEEKAIQAAKDSKLIMETKPGRFMFL